MRTLYASAANVLSWLGGGDGSPSTVPSAFDFIRNIVKATQFPTSASMTRRQQLESGFIVKSGTTEDRIMLDTIVDPRLIFVLSKSKSVIDFFSLEYWHRVWIVQEIVLSRPERNIIIFGDELVSFRDVQVFRDSWLAFIKELQRNRELELALSEIPGWDSVSWMQYLQRMEECLVIWSYYDFLRGLLASEESLFYVILTSTYDATDPRDSVFALLGMISSPRIVPDYTEPIESIYLKWFVTVLQDWQNFQPLYFSGLIDTSDRKQLPSWVPDLRSRRPDSPVWDATLAGTLETPHKHTNSSFGEQTTLAFPYISYEQTLHARGIWCDEVVQVKRIGVAQAAESIVQFCTSYLSASNTKLYKTGIHLLHAVFQVLMCGVNRFNPSQSESETSLIRSDFQLIYGTNQLQLNNTTPLLQAVAKFLRQKGSLSPDKVDDFVLEILCRPSAPLGTNISDLHLAAAFIAFLLTGKRQQGQPAYSILQSLGLPPGPSFLKRFLQCFFRDSAAELQHRVSYDLFLDETAVSLINSLKRYFMTYDQTIFVTATGFLGNGPAGMAIGNRIVVLDGAKMPFVMRNTWKSVVLVGPCYIEGLSDGEPAGMARRGEALVEDILIS